MPGNLMLRAKEGTFPDSVFQIANWYNISVSYASGILALRVPEH